MKKVDGIAFWMTTGPWTAIVREPLGNRWYLFASYATGEIQIEDRRRDVSVLGSAAYWKGMSMAEQKAAAEYLWSIWCVREVHDI